MSSGKRFRWLQVQRHAHIGAFDYSWLIKKIQKLIPQKQINHHSPHTSMLVWSSCHIRKVLITRDIQLRTLISNFRAFSTQLILGIRKGSLPSHFPTSVLSTCLGWTSGIVLKFCGIAYDMRKCAEGGTISAHHEGSWPSRGGGIDWKTALMWDSFFGQCAEISVIQIL